MRTALNVQNMLSIALAHQKSIKISANRRQPAEQCSNLSHNMTIKPYGTLVAWCNC